MVLVGRILRPHGNRGNVVIFPETDFGEERFGPGSTLYRLRADRIEPIVVSEGREHAGRWFVGFEGIESINDAETLRGLELKVPADAIKPLGANTYYVHDLIGCRVRTVAGEDVGPVVRVDFLVGIPMLVVDGDGEVLVPLRDNVCRRVDLAAKLIEIDPPPGLLEVNRPKKR